MPAHLSDLTHLLAAEGPQEEQLALDNRRRDPRIPVLVTAAVHPLGPGRRDRLAGLVLDVSRNGLKLHLSTELPEGIEVRVILNKAFVMGRVRYCVRVDLGYHVGIETDEVLPVTHRKRVWPD